MIQDKIFFDEKDPTGVSYNTPFTVYGSYQGRLWSKTPSGTIKYYTQNSDLSVYATTGSNQFSGSQTVTGSLTVTGGITGSATTASYVEYANVANKPTLVSGSAQVSFNGITDKPTLVSGSSQITYSGLSGIPSGIVSGSAQVTALGFATTGSNTFQANQTITGSLFITQNLVVVGSSSIQYISSSVLDIADNIITVNAFNPAIRFGGLAVIDSGSSPQVSGSLLFDSIKDQWIFVHQNQSVVTSSVVLMGPETYNDLGNESYISANRLPKGSGVEHLRDSNITDTGTVVSINSNAAVTGSFTVVTGSAVELQVTNLGVNMGSALTDSHIISGSLRVNPNGLFVSGSGNVGIGTTSPLSKFHVNTGTNQNFRVRPGTDVGATNGVALNSRTDDDGSLQQLTLRASDVIMLTSGNVGIGTASPGSFVVLEKSSNSGSGSTFPRLTIKNTLATQGDGSSTFNFADINISSGNEAVNMFLATTYAAGSWAPAGIINVATNHGLQFKTNNTLALTIASTGAATFASSVTIQGGNSLFVNNASNTRSGYLKTSGEGTELSSFAGAGEPLILIAPDTTATIRFYTAGSTFANERMRITSGGNVGIGVNNPQSQLHLNGTITFTEAGFNTVRLNQIVSSHSDGSSTNNNLRFLVSDGSGTTAERMRINGSGNVLIGTTTDNGNRLNVNGNLRIDNTLSSPGNLIETAGLNVYLRPASGYQVFIDSGNGLTVTGTSGVETQNGGGYKFWNDAQSRWWLMYTYAAASNQLRFNYFGNDVGSINPSSGAYTALSDINKKKDFELSTIGLNAILGLKPTLYRMRNDESEGDKELGFIAQEVKEFIPQAYVESGEDDAKFIGLNYNAIVATLVKSVQELKSENDTLKSILQHNNIS